MVAVNLDSAGENGNRPAGATSSTSATDATRATIATDSSITGSFSAVITKPTRTADTARSTDATATADSTPGGKVGGRNIGLPSRSDQNATALAANSTGATRTAGTASAAGTTVAIVAARRSIASCYACKSGTAGSTRTTIRRKLRDGAPPIIAI